MKFQIYIILILFIGCKASSDRSSKAVDDNTQRSELFTIGGEPVFTDEFLYVYKKNNVNNDSAFTRKDIDEYLDLYIRFKLKIAEAKKRGMDTTAAFRGEFATYQDQLKKPYLTENKVTKQLINEAYERYKWEVNASHILIQVEEQASPQDTLEAYNEIMDIRQQAINGADFAHLASEYSDDPSAGTNGGNLGYFSSFQMVYPFESAAYNTDEGAISEPVRTKFGYHIIKVLDKRPSQGSVEVSHIMIRTSRDQADSLQTRNKIFEIYDQAVGGVSWDDLTRQFSEDINTKNTGGRLKPFKVGQMPYTFQEAAFQLRESGDISDPVMTPYGWHIIKLEKRYPLETFEELEPTIKSRIDRDSRAQLNKKALIGRLKRENSFKETTVKTNLWNVADSSLTQGQWTYPKGHELLDKTLFEMADEHYTVKQFFNYLQENQRPNSYAPEVYMRLLYNNFVDDRIIAYEENHLEDKYIEYRMLVKEYREGILLFELMEKEVWNKAVKDSTGLKEYYESHLDQYQWGKRVRATLYNSGQQAVLAEIEELVNTGDTSVLVKEELEERFNNKTALTLQIEEGVFESGDHPVIGEIDWSAGISRIEMNGRHNLVQVHEVLQPGPKPLNEIKGLVISDYQSYLEKQWVKGLKEKYPVEVNESGLKYVYDELEKK